MRGPNRKRDVTDLPAIRLREGRYMLGLGQHTWRKKWEEVYRFIVLHWKTTNGTMLNLEYLVAAVYPDIAKNRSARAQIAHDFMWNLMEKRQADRHTRARKKAAQENDAVGS